MRIGIGRCLRTDVSGVRYVRLSAHTVYFSGMKRIWACASGLWNNGARIARSVWTAAHTRA
ncbi:MAG: hypothetical protein V3V48_05775 [Candidatus Aminicenantaceae bacterium]